jgi:DNA invertase Pin-like site-specific DNA recombinase
MKMKAIYIRTSTLEQTPELQLRDIKVLLKSLNYNIKDMKIYSDKQSAWKDNIERKQFNELRKLIKKRKVSDIIVWDLDRIYRNREKLKGFFIFFKVYNCKIHSYNQNWLEELHKIMPPFNEIMHDMMLQIMGWIAQDESDRKSKRIKMAVRKKEGVTKSYKGNKWGRKTISTQKYNRLKSILKDNLTYKQMSDELNLSVGVVHKYAKIIQNEKNKV